jgi:hypothetical protein
MHSLGLTTILVALAVAPTRAEVVTPSWPRGPHSSAAISQLIKDWPEERLDVEEARSIAAALSQSESNLPVIEFMVEGRSYENDVDTGVRNTYTGTEGNGFRCMTIQRRREVSGEVNANSAKTVRIVYGPDFAGTHSNEQGLPRLALLAVRSDQPSSYLLEAERAASGEHSWSVGGMLHRNIVRNALSLADSVETAIRAKSSLSLRRGPDGHTTALIITWHRAEVPLNQIWLIRSHPFLHVGGFGTVLADGSEGVAKWVDLPRDSEVGSFIDLASGTVVYLTRQEDREASSVRVVDVLTIKNARKSPLQVDWKPGFDCLDAKPGQVFLSSGASSGTITWTVQDDGLVQMTGISGPTYEELQASSGLAMESARGHGWLGGLLLIVAGSGIVVTAIVIRRRRKEAHR